MSSTSVLFHSLIAALQLSIAGSSISFTPFLVVINFPFSSFFLDLPPGGGGGGSGSISYRHQKDVTDVAESAALLQIFRHIGDNCRRLAGNIVISIAA